MTTAARWLGLDIGERTIGLSVSDPFGWTAQGAGVIRRRSEAHDMQALQDIVAQYGVTGLVAGLPRNMDGSEGERAEAVRSFAERARETLGLPLVYWDERLSTRAAERTLLEADVSRAKRRRVIDQQAAVFILEGFLLREASKRGVGREP